MHKQCTCLDEIETGDLLIFSDDGDSWLSKIILYVVRLFTRSEYGHVGIAVKKDDKLFVFDASIPFIRLRPIEDTDSFYFVHMETPLDLTNMLHEYLGLKYSMSDAIRAYLGLTTKTDGRYQCVELVKEIYNRNGLVFKESKLTPSAFVDSLLSSNTNYSLRRHVGADT